MVVLFGPGFYGGYWRGAGVGFRRLVAGDTTRYPNQAVHVRCGGAVCVRGVGSSAMEWTKIAKDVWPCVSYHKKVKITCGSSCSGLWWCE